MKIKATQKEFRNNDNIIKLSYCEAQYLLKGIEPIYYTCGVYGWNADIYYFNNYYIVTGYRPFGKIQPKYDTTRKYEIEASKIYNSCNGESWEVKAKKINKLLEDFINEIKGGL